MIQPQALTGNAPAPVARTQGAPHESNVAAQVMAACHSPTGKGKYIATNSPHLERQQKNHFAQRVTYHETEQCWDLGQSFYEL